MIMNIKVFLLCILVTQSYCVTSHNLPASAAARFGEWFVSGDSTTANEISEYQCTPQELDSLFLSAQAHSRLQSGKSSIQLSDPAGVQYTVGFATPTSYATDTLYPLIVYLHGGAGVAAATKGAGAYDMLSPLLDSIPTFLASPSANRSCPWWSQMGMERIFQTIRFMRLHYPIDPDRIFLAGVSDGATGCYATAITASTAFAGFFAVSGFAPFLESMGFPMIAGNLMQRPVYTVNAGKDRIYPIDQVIQMVDKLNSAGCRIVLKTYPDQEHGFDYRAQEFGTLAAYVRQWKSGYIANSFDWTMLPGWPFRAQHILSYQSNGDMQTLSHISGYIDNDTLYVKFQNVTSCRLYFLPDDPQFHFVSVNNQKPSRISVKKTDLHDLLKLYKQTNAAAISGIRIYTIQI